MTTEAFSIWSWVLFVLAFVIFYALFGAIGGNGVPLWYLLMDIGVWLVLIFLAGMICAALAGVFFLTHLPFRGRVFRLLPAAMFIITVFLVALRFAGEDPVTGGLGIPI